ncbi:MAG: aminopeptidase [Spirochaetia bacterium]|jgi:aminopeptidase
MDRRWKDLGSLLVNYSVGVRAGEKVMISMGEVETFPLVRGVHEAVLRAGGFPQVQFLSETLRHQLLKLGSREQLSWMPEMEASGMEWADVYIGLRGAYNIHEHDDIPTQAIALNQGAMGKISRLRWEKTRWCLVRVPNAAFAQAAETDEETIMEMFFNATLLDWEKESGKWREWAQKLDRGSVVRVTGKDTDLSFSIKGRKWVAGDGKINMPDGEIMTAPVEDSLNGQISFEFPGVLSGRLINDIRLRFEDGMLVEATSSTNQDFLRTVLATDPGASRVGEFAMGTNMAVNRFCKDILLDEKIGGTVHLALGRSYPECGGKNNSALHWDIVKDIRTEGAVLVDGQPVLEKGKFLL